MSSQISIKSESKNVQESNVHSTDEKTHDQNIVQDEKIEIGNVRIYFSISLTEKTNF